MGRSGVARKYYAGGRVNKALALIARYEAERSSLGIVFRLGIFVTDTDVESQPWAYVEVVLRVTRILVGPDITESVSGLIVVIRQAKKEIGQIGARANARRRPKEKEGSVSKVVVLGVVLVRREVEAEFHIVAALGPREVVVISVDRIRERSRPAEVETGVEIGALKPKLRRPGDNIGSDIDPEISGSHLAERGSRRVLAGIGADGGNPCLVQKTGREDVRVIDASGISLHKIRGSVAIDVGEAVRAGDVAIVSRESR